ncbi:MAG: PKD domain-containing protein, partial [Bacteroidia bacterium]|nr:PKD domain-containing protein [Bacteroidia bacterium]
MYYIKYIFIPLYILLYFKAGFSQCPVVPAFSFSQTCGTGTFQFTDLSTATSGSITGWYWDFDDGANSANQNPAHTFTLGNTYDVMLTVTHSTGCTAQVSHSIIASTAPVADFSFAPDNVCSETLINFISNSSGSNISYSWNFGDGNTSTQQNPSHIFYAYGSGSQIFNVTLTVTDVNHCTASKTKPVTIIKGPQVLYYETNNFKTCLTSYGTVSETAEIINASPDSLTIASYTINWGDGSGTSPILLPFHAVSHTYTALGSYPITIIATGNNGCKTTFTGNYIIEAYPSASVQGAPGTPIQGCTPLTINVINNSTNITPSTLTTIYWGDGLLPTILPLGSSGGTISYTYTTSSCDNGSQDPFLIELKVQNACGTTSSYWGPITVYAAPQSNFIASDTLSCTGTNITFTNQSIANLCAGNPATYFTWNFGDGIVIGPATGLSSMNHSYSNPGTYIVSLTAENNSANGCGSTTSNLAIVIGELAADFISDTACFGSATSFFDISTSSNGTIQSWDWPFNDDGIPWWNFWDNSSSLQNPTHAYTHPGQFSVELTVTDNNGCEKTISKNVVVDYLPVANFNWDPFCSGSTVQFHDLSAGINADIESWSWNFGDGATSLQQNPIHLYSSTGLFNVTLTVTDEHGCTDNIVQQVEAGTNPVANFIYTSACAGQPVQFNDISNAPDAEIVSWLWNFGDASTSPAQNPEHTYSSTGSYNVNLIITDENNCTDDTTIAVVLNNSPSAMFSSNQVCFGLPTSFIDASSGPSDIVAWSWNFGDGGSSSLQNPAHIYNEQENFTASLVVTDENGCIDTVFQNVLIDSIPHVDFTFDPFCFGQETQFINNSYPTGGATIISWNWSFGDSGTSTAETPVHTYATAATFNVTLTATDSKGCSSIITEQVTVFPEPLADFEAVTACSGTQTVFTDESTSAAGNITSWQWNFGDGNTSSQQAPTHTYSTPGTYNVQLIVSDINGCYDTIIKEVNSVFTIIADFIAVNVCQGTTTCFTDISYSSGGGITSWSWHFNDPNVPWYMPWLNSSGSQNPCHEFTQAGNYTIDLDIEDESGCTGSVSKTIVIYDGPTANFSASSSSLGEPTIFTDQSASGTGSITSWSWNFSDGSPVSPMQNPEYTYAIAGTYNVTLTITDSNGCTSSITKQITVIDLPHADFSATMVCFGETTIFTDQSTSPGGQITGWQWNFDDGNTSAVQNPSHLYSSPGIYNVQLIANDINGVFDTVVKPVTVYPLPVADFIYDTVCDGGTTHFYDQSSVQSENIASWSWSFNDDGIPWWNFWGNSSSDQNPTHDYTHNGIFSVQLSVEDNNGCFDTVVQNIFVNDPPVAEFNSEPTVLGDPSVFTDLSTPGSGIINSWYWNFGDGNTSTAQAPVHTYSLPGTYVVSLTVTDNFGCTSTITHNHLVYDGPVPDFTYTNVCFGETTHFEDQSVSPGVSFVAWNWDFGDGGTSSQQNPDHYYSSAGTFTVQLIVTDENDLNDTVIKNVIIYSLPDPDFTWYNTCEGDTAFFNDLSSGDIVSWSWNFGDILSPANTSTAQNPLHIFSGTGVYSVQLLVENEYGCINSVVHNITVSQNPIAGFNATTAILGAPTLFTDTSVPGNGTIEQWYWNFGDL